MYERHRFRTDPDDYRPIAFPPPGPYWCPGRGRGYSIVIAYLPVGESLLNWWPDATEVETEKVEVIHFTDRFPRPDWWSDEKTSDLKPTTMDGLKRLAKRIKRERGIQHAEALEVAARQAGFASFHAARAAL